jgi:predicted DNA-binding transcriptional regulator YafY
MSRASRLLELLQILRRHRAPVSGHALADELNISVRTLYRDIATLQGQGADITGEAGVGYQLQPGFTLPPLMLTRNELEALLLGMSWVADRGDTELQTAAREVIAKMSAVLPDDLRRDLSCATMLVGPGSWASHDDKLYEHLRHAMRNEHKVLLDYRDQHNHTSQRIVWPCALAVFDHVRILVAWCELRGDFRHFRIDRVIELKPQNERYPRRRVDLLRDWHQQMDQECRPMTGEKAADRI